MNRNLVYESRTKAFVNPRRLLKDNGLGAGQSFHIEDVSGSNPFSPPMHSRNCLGLEGTVCRAAWFTRGMRRTALG